MIEPLCSICQYGIYPIESIEILICDHVFHKLCILDWFKNKSNCPICRISISCPESHIYVQLRNNDIRENTSRRFYRIKCILVTTIICSFVIPIILLLQHYLKIDYNFNVTNY